MNTVSPLIRLYPFTALAGQPLMRRALLANALCPEIGGVLLRGQKGTAKSTAVRALAQLLPPVSMVVGCPCHCSPQGPFCPACEQMAAAGPLPVEYRQAPLVTLPLSATEDRLIGALDTESALRSGRRVFQPGLLAAAHQGILYVDEINLLPDNLQDLLLDTCASGINRLEREGCVMEHPAHFSLIGSMNPEEGPLRPQLQDRFGLCVDVQAPKEPDLRLEILRRREEFDIDPIQFMGKWKAEQDKLTKQLRDSRILLSEIRVPEILLRKIALLTTEACCAGHRGELALLRTARALAALDGCTAVRDEHVQEAELLALTHRKRSAVSSAPAPKERTSVSKSDSAPKPTESPSSQCGTSDRAMGTDHDNTSSMPDTTTGIGREQIFTADTPYQVRPFQPPVDRYLRKGSGRHSRTRTKQKSGRCVGYQTIPPQRELIPDIALEPTIRAAIIRQAINRRGEISLPLHVCIEDWRYKRRERRMGNLIVFAVDASGSMGAAGRMREVKSAVLSLLLHAYQKRDQVALVAFRGQRGQTLLYPTSSVELASKKLEELPTGGRTPLADGLREAHRIIDNALRKKPDTRPMLILISDGRCNVTPPLEAGTALDAALAEAIRIEKDKRIYSLVVDVEQKGLLQFGQARQLAEAMKAEYLPVEHLSSSTLLGFIRSIVR